MSKATVIRAKDRPKGLNVIGETITLLASEKGGYELFHQQGPPDIGPPPHSHGWSESFFVLDGTLEVMAEGETFRLDAGDMITVPPNTVHLYKNITNVSMLSLNSSAGAAAFFAEVDAKVAMPPNIPVLLEIAAKHGLSFAGPPPAE